MPARVRTRSTYVGGSGTSTWNGVTSTRSAKPGSDYCADVTGNPHGENPLDIRSAGISSLGAITGTFMYLGLPNDFINWPPTCAQVGMAPPLSKPVGEKFQNASEAIGNSHPGNPAIDLPLFLFELKDVPHMLKDAYGLAKGLRNSAGSDRLSDVLKFLASPKARAKDYLAYQFGWAPLVSDLKDISGVTKWMQQRSKMLSNASQKGISRTAQLGEFQDVAVQNNYPYNSTNGSWYASAQTRRSSKSWVVSHWSADPVSFATLSNKAQVNQLQRAALGLNFSLSTAWNALPWSWLTDWFIDIDSILKVRSNRMGIRFKNASVMVHRRAELTVMPYVYRGLSAPPTTAYSESKSRVQVSPSIPISGLDFLGGKQLAILSALQVARSR